jgi:hypothetical protein
LLNFEFKVVSALKVCVVKGWLPEEAMTTACLIESVTKWYTILSARTKFDGLWKNDTTGKTEERLHYLSLEFIPLFQQIVPINSSKLWLPAMSSVLISTKAVLTVYDIYVEKGKVALKIFILPSNL